ncbi:hypothetical protein GCM10009841_24330 [Microlunatus panaciterrae]|uniref:Protein-disulfide isomerase n=1 Tax=Microlunatus panaciterrae TaxID=400768 RepID=A0ABS2RHA5_9ACTN|nr:thioredoxin domain-containing protein [Microlunatus panaciterrae]MBM7797314.1 protein-disulfide isomerase [Microlunatus panaciterrae]
MSNARSRAEQQRDLQLRRRRERRLLTAVAAGLVLLVVAGGVLLQTWRTHRTPSAATHSSAGFAPVSVEPGKPLLLGKAGAPVKITLYEDFHCPHCADFEEKLGPVITEQQNSGTVVVELFPMAFIDEGSLAASNAMACAAENGFGQSYYLGLFANHTLQWNQSQLIDLATRTAGGSRGRFDSCVTTGAHASWVDSINAAAQSAGVDSTPTMFLDGNPVDVGRLTPDTLRTMISEAAAK